MIMGYVHNMLIINYKAKTEIDIIMTLDYSSSGHSNKKHIINITYMAI